MPTSAKRLRDEIDSAVRIGCEEFYLQVDDARSILAELERLLAWAKKSHELLKYFHGQAGWEEYQQSPEMKRYAALMEQTDAN